MFILQPETATAGCIGGFTVWPVNGRNHPVLFVRHAAAELLATTSHPAWNRFSTGLTGTESVLVVSAPAGLGRAWFAQSWPGDDDVFTVHVGKEPKFSNPGEPKTASSLAETFESHISPAPSKYGDHRRAAIILDSPTIDWTALAAYDYCLARVPDLLLTVDEIAALSEGFSTVPLGSGNNHGDRAAPQELHRLTGGWLEPTLLLLREPSALDRAQESILPFLSHWIDSQHNGWEAAKSAFLDPITTQTLSAFFSEIHGDPPLLEDLVAAGFLVTAEDGTTFMPELIRQALKTLVRQNDPALADDLVAVAIDAVAESSDLISAVQQAVIHRHWRALGTVLIERGLELFTTDARIIRQLLTVMPEKFVDQWLGDFTGAALRLLEGARADGMSFVLPDGRLEYERDSVASRMLASTTRLYRNPGPQALAFGLIEVGYLRLAGYDEQAAAAAHRLLTALHTAESQRRLRPELASVVNLHAGVALEIGGDPVRASSSYYAAFYHVEGTDHAFLLADSTSKLALLTALRGDTHEARTWLTEHEKWVGKVGWGRSMVTRNAQLARVFVGLADLDLAAVDEALSVLPVTPDQNETWQVHTYLLAMRSILAGRPQRALEVTNRMRCQRPHPSNTPLARALFAVTDRAAYITGAPGLTSPELAGTPPPVPELFLLDSYQALLTGDLGRASLLLSRARNEVDGDRWLNFATQLDIIMSDQDNEVMIEHLIDDIDSGHGFAVDLLVLRRHGILSDSHLQRLPEETRVRIAKIPEIHTDERIRPTLTPRETEVLDGLREGLTRRQIAEKQFRSENTVRSQVRSLYQKLDAATLEEALEAARRWGL